MKPFLFKWLTAVFAVALLSSIVSMMATFVGSQGADLQDLLALQVVLAPIAVTVAIGCFGLLIRRYGYRGAFERSWAYLPGWLLFAILAANSLVVIAELSFLLIERHTGNPRPWQEHVPTATALSSSVALAVCYTSFRLAKSK